MTLEKAIIHAEAVAKTKEREAKENRNHGGWAYDDKAAKCSACAAEYRQFAEWLKILKSAKFEYNEAWLTITHPTPDVTYADKQRAQVILDKFRNSLGAISALQTQDVNDKNTEDTISRRNVIDELKRYFHDEYYQRTSIQDCINCFIEDILTKLPSAQPENIRCYECKHGTHSGCGNVYICNVSPELVMKHTGDFYCGYAKRKTDEEVN